MSDKPGSGSTSSERAPDNATSSSNADAGKSDRPDRSSHRQSNRSGNREQRDDQSGQRSGPRSDTDDAYDNNRGNRRRRRGRDRYRDRQGGRDRYNEGEPVIAEDDVLLPVAGILDVLDNYAFVRTSGYLPGPNDIYVSLAQVRKYGLRRGDAVTGSVRQPKEGERREKFNALVRLETVNGAEPDGSKQRPDFNKLTPLYPQDRLRLETEPHLLSTRVIDLVAPIGKGQRGLDRLATQGRQDDDSAGDRQRHHHEQPRGSPHGRAG